MAEQRFTGKDLAFGRRVRKYRKALNLTQEDLAEKVGVTQTTIGLIEVGKRRVSLKTIQKIAKSLGVKVSDLLLD